MIEFKKYISSLGLLASEDYGKDLTSIENLLKKHQLLEADIAAHADRVNEMNMQADNLLESGQFDPREIQKRQKVICRKIIFFETCSYCNSSEVVICLILS